VKGEEKPVEGEEVDREGSGEKIGDWTEGKRVYSCRK